jgi:Lysyl oxidase
VRSLTPRAALVLALAALPAAAAVAQQRQTVFDKDPCPSAQLLKLRCPDLRMKRPFGLRVQYSRGRAYLRAGNSIDSVGAGPVELRGVRTSRRGMRATQRIYKTDGGYVTARTGARLRYTLGHEQKHYWKLYRAARFQLWRLDRHGHRSQMVRRGGKVAYCLRDLRHTHRLRGSPRHPVYPACSTNPRLRHARLGTSVGWSDIYPPTYVKQWIDATGLRGCFALVHIADPDNKIFESNETDNQAQVVVRLPFRHGPQHCPGHSTGQVNHETGRY